MTKGQSYSPAATMEANPPAFALTAAKKNHLAISDLEIWEMAKYEINRGAKIADSPLHPLPAAYSEISCLYPSNASTL